MNRKILRLLVVFIGGFVLAKGSVQLTKHRHLNNPHGHIVGALMLLAGLFGGVLMIAGVVAAALYSLLNLSTSDRVQKF